MIDSQPKRKKFLFIIFLIVLVVSAITYLNNKKGVSSDTKFKSSWKKQELPYPNPDLPDGWTRVYIKDVGNIDIPPTMEVQSGIYREFVNEYKKRVGLEVSELTAQQKGLNTFEREGFSKYARVMLRTVKDKPGAFPVLNTNISDFTDEDIKKLDDFSKQATIESFLNSKLKIIEWYPTKILRINGMTCANVSYKRQLDTNPYVLVNQYIFFNYDRAHILTLSYRLSEEDYWKSDFEKILSSFRITNIRQ